MIRALSAIRLDFSSENITYLTYFRYFIFGLLLPLGFAPFHLPGMAILGLALFYIALTNRNNESPFLCGLVFGLGFFGFGVSWIYISVHEYGHLHGVIAALITFIFLLYLAVFPALTATVFTRLAIKPWSIYSALLFSALWIGSEYLRSTLFGGFPWLLIGFGQFDTPVKFLLPVIGVLGVGFVTCFAAALLGIGTQVNGARRFLYFMLFVITIVISLILKPVKWAEEKGEAISVGVIQTNLSMRDKWDENLFWDLLQRYQRDTEQLMGTRLIVLPESAIPLPATYISEFLNNLQQEAKKAGSAILLGIPHPTTIDENYYFNAMISLGKAKGTYFKQHLVPFGEYIPKPFQFATNWLGIPAANLKPGKSNQPLVTIHRHPIASLICYELAYGDLLRQQLPAAEWIVSISDDGWFGHSLAMYQQLQMAQTLSMEAARYQVVANNDGLSSVINTKGEIINSLPAFSSGILQSNVFAASGKTPWVTWGDLPVLLFSLLIVTIFSIYRLIFIKVGVQPIAAKHKRRYPYQPH